MFFQGHGRGYCEAECIEQGIGSHTAEVCSPNPSSETWLIPV